MYNSFYFRLKTLLALALLVICFAYKTTAQQQGLSTQIIYFPSISCVGCTDTFSVQIKNLDSATYTGFINIYVSGDTSAFSVASLCAIPLITISGFDSIQNTCNMTFDSTYFNTGNNIVVVWSTGNAKMPADTAWTNVLLNPAGIHEVANSLSFSLYPSITSDFVEIKLSKQESVIEKIRIIDILGQEVQTISLATNEKKNLINVSAIDSGIYFLEVSFGNLRKTQKFVKID